MNVVDECNRCNRRMDEISCTGDGRAIQSGVMSSSTRRIKIST